MTEKVDELEAVADPPVVAVDGLSFEITVEVAADGGVLIGCDAFGGAFGPLRGRISACRCPRPLGLQSDSGPIRWSKEL
ncbi:hypothetical protein [Natrinema sp. SYSU A 869]|uniref:hypothetical protein n=1 Tax=Natrinema sp. SYSU A 869 TaxID=2871694 RepID=UPI001CA3ACE0|nr:hypothetical protein [Natrinema sp. SYSU A 869]